MLLNEQEIMDINQNAEFDSAIGFARAIESAVLEKLKAQEPEITGAERYRVEKTGHGFWPYCVRAGTGSRELFVGYQKQCTKVANALATAFEDGKFVATTPLPPDDVVQKYEELLYAVHRKFPDETRHQTALRYIKTAESPSYTNAAMKEMK